MQKWLFFLAAALLLNCVHAQANAEADIYYTNNKDRYYHLNPDCDRPAATNWWDGSPVEYYERDVYRKYAISEAAALEFDKLACPICVTGFQPVYLGDHFLDWPYEAPPWEISGLDPEQEQSFLNKRPQAFIQEIVKTNDTFNAAYESVYNRETDTYDRKHPYPDVYAGQYSNNAGCISYCVVNPDDEILSTFKRLFGGGAWIVPAKYGYADIMARRAIVVVELQEWCADHPDVDARWVSASGPDYTNYAVIGINGADWKQAAAAMEETAPIFVHFVREELITEDGSKEYRPQ